MLGVADGQGSLACCSPWGRKESDMTEWLNWTELSLHKSCFYGLSACVPPIVICRNHNPQCGSVWEWDLWEVIRVRWGYEGGFTNHDETIIKRESSPFLHKHRGKVSERVAIYKAESSHHRHWTDQHLNLRLLSFQKSEKINFYCLSHPVCGSLLWQPCYCCC